MKFKCDPDIIYALLRKNIKLLPKYKASEIIKHKYYFSTNIGLYKLLSYIINECTDLHDFGNDMLYKIPSPCIRGYSYYIFGINYHNNIISIFEVYDDNGDSFFVHKVFAKFNGKNIFTDEESNIINDILTLKEQSLDTERNLFYKMKEMQERNVFDEL